VATPSCANSGRRIFTGLLRELSQKNIARGTETKLTAITDSQSGIPTKLGKDKGKKPISIYSPNSH
jgi:hypothetical protein